METKTFKQWLEGSDIFGFESKNKEVLQTDLDNKPMKSFDTELMMEYLAKKKLGKYDASPNFINEIQWGKQFGAVKLEVDSRMTFYIKKMSFDLEGNRRWITKKTYQLNRNGFGGYEDSVAQEIFGEIKSVFRSGTEGPTKDYKLEPLVTNISSKLKRVAQSKFMYEGIKRLNDDCYQIVFSVGNHGLEAPGHRRIEQNVTEVSYDRSLGTIKATNYNIESPTGGPREWKVMPSNVELFFFPSQDRDEISETLAVRFKYY